MDTKTSFTSSDTGVNVDREDDNDKFGSQSKDLSSKNLGHNHTLPHRSQTSRASPSNSSTDILGSQQAITVTAHNPKFSKDSKAQSNPAMSQVSTSEKNMSADRSYSSLPPRASASPHCTTSASPLSPPRAASSARRQSDTDDTAQIFRRHFMGKVSND